MTFMNLEVVYHPDLAPRLEDFGVGVPLAANRSDVIANELILRALQLHRPQLERLPVLTHDDFRLVHDLDFLSRLSDEALVHNEIFHCYELNRYGSTKQSVDANALVEHCRMQCRGTYYAAIRAWKNQSATFFLGGGMHHAMSFVGRGFCLFNDIVLAARLLQRDHFVQRILMIDVDAHKGDGQAQLCAGDHSIQTLSIHMQDGWPLDGSLGQGPWLIESDIDIAIKQGDEHQYVFELQKALTQVGDQTFDFAFVVLGADPYEHDELQSASLLQLSAEQMLERDQLIYDFLSRKNIPHTYVMGGGYGARAHEPYVNFLLHQLVR